MNEKIKRDAFLYMQGEEKEFAQCATCLQWTGSRCTIIGPTKEVGEDDSCGLYVLGEGYAGRENIVEAPQVTPQEVGFVSREVRCENCFYFDASHEVCLLFARLNKSFAADFDLDTKVAPLGCCNANQPK